MKNKTLSLDQIASICGVSLNLVKRWVDKKVLKIDQSDDCKNKVTHSDMIEFLVKYNMQIPDSIIPVNAKKILFIYLSSSYDKSFMRFIIDFIGKLKKENKIIIADHISYGHDAKMKIMIFNPDLIILDMIENCDHAICIIEKIKNIDEFSSISILAVTSINLIDEYRSILKRYGIYDVVINTNDIDCNLFIKAGI